MFIVWGKKLVYRKAGYVADYCPICREVQPFKLTRVGVAGHVYYITLTQGDFVRHEIECQCCKAVYETNIGYYQEVEKTELPVMELIQRTYPNVRAAYQEQMEFDQNLRFNGASFTPEQRHNFITNTLARTHLKLAKRFERTHIDRRTWMAIVVAILAFMFLPVLITKVLGDVSVMGSAILISSCLAFSGLIWVGVGSRSRYVKKEILPMVHKALDVIKPTEEEFKNALNYLKKMEYKYMSKLKAKELASVFKK